MKGHEGMKHEGGSGDHHANMTQDFKRRFFVSLVISAPILLMSPTIQSWFGFTTPRFPGYDLVLFALASAVAFYGGWPFYEGARRDLELSLIHI